MFKILGADGKEYGPVTVEQLKQWINEGRANHETMAQKAGDYGWKPLAQYADFSSLFPAQPPALPTSPVGAAPAAAVSAVSADDRDRALQLASGPAIALIVTAGLNIMTLVIGLVMQFVSRGFVPPASGIDPEVMRVIEMLNGPIGAVIRVILIAVSLLILLGALRMQQLRSRGLAMTAAILAMIPCTSPCCLLGLPFGIWALVVLCKPEVQPQFDR